MIELREALTIGLRHANNEVKACELRYSDQYKARCIEDVRKIEAALAGLPVRDGFYEEIWRDFISLQSGDVKLLCRDVERYQELIYAVGKKYPNETRHETALRYIRQAEQVSNAPASAQPEQPYNQFGTDY